jgi:hypothetical protein
MEPEGSSACSQEPEYRSLSWAKCIQSPTSHPISLKFILILPSHVRSSEGNLSSRFSYRIFGCTSLPSHACYMHCQLHPPWFDHSNNIWWVVQIMKLLTTEFSSALLLRNRVVPGSNLGPETDHRYWDFVWIFESLQANLEFFCFFSLLCVLHACPLRHAWSDLTHNVWRGVQIMKLIMHFSLAPPTDLHRRQ